MARPGPRAPINGIDVNGRCPGPFAGELADQAADVIAHRARGDVEATPRHQELIQAMAATRILRARPVVINERALKHRHLLAAKTENDESEARDPEATRRVYAMNEELATAKDIHLECVNRAVPNDRLREIRALQERDREG